uniref:C2 NT-type domain-containing protein n=1 Tax=Ascaris lumbricoides TaxID=6252 RepID=A0A9J2P6S3_ASCLU
MSVAVQCSLFVANCAVDVLVFLLMYADESNSRVIPLVCKSNLAVLNRMKYHKVTSKRRVLFKRTIADYCTHESFLWVTGTKRGRLTQKSASAQLDQIKSSIQIEVYIEERIVLEVVLTNLATPARDISLMGIHTLDCLPKRYSGMGISKAFAYVSIHPDEVHARECPYNLAPAVLPECTRLDEHSYSLDVPTHLPTLYYANVESEAAVVQSARLFDGSTMPFEAVKDIQPNYYVPRSSSGQLPTPCCPKHCVNSSWYGLVPLNSASTMDDIKALQLSHCLQGWRSNSKKELENCPVETERMASLSNLIKALKEKTLECDSLKKKVEKFERDKQQWENQKRALESKQPMDVQMLQREKRELTMQLDREQNEKHELFLQINTLIAQVAEANRDAAEQQNSALLKAENDSLKSQLGNIQKIQTQLNNDVHSLQEELRRKTAEVESCKEDAKRRLELVENEKSKLQESIEGLERELQMKSAALQSLMLAKQDKRSGVDAATIERLTSDNEELTKQLTDTAKQVVAESEQKSLLNKQIEELRGELNAMEEKAARHEAEKLKNQKELEKKTAEAAEYRQRVELLQSSSGDREKQITTLERKLSERQSAHEAMMLELANLKAIVDASKSDNEIMKLRLEESQRTAKENEERCAEMQTNLQVGANAAHGLEAKIAASEAKLRAAEERTQKFELELERHRDETKKLSGQLSEQEQRNAEAQLEMKTSNAKIETLEVEIKNLRNQLDAQHGIDEQVKHLREELRLAGERNAALIEAIQKTENDADEADRSNRETIEELEEEVRSLQEKMRVMEGGEEERLNKMADLQSEKAKFEQKSRDAENKVLSITKDLEVARAELSKFELTIEQMRAENNKLMAKASLEDEVLTLATSLRTAHDDIRQYRMLTCEDCASPGSAKQEEIGKLNKEIRNLREENDRLTPSEKQAESLRAELIDLKQQFENIKEAEIAQTRSELELRHQQTLLDMKKHHELRITEMEQQIEHLKEEHLQENSQRRDIVCQKHNECPSTKSQRSLLAARVTPFPPSTLYR